MNSDPFLALVWGFVAIAVVGTAWTTYSMVRKARAERVQLRA